MVLTHFGIFLWCQTRRTLLPCLVSFGTVLTFSYVLPMGKNPNPGHPCSKFRYCSITSADSCCFSPFFVDVANTCYFDVKYLLVAQPLPNIIVDAVFLLVVCLHHFFLPNNQVSWTSTMVIFGTYKVKCEVTRAQVFYYQHCSVKRASFPVKFNYQTQVAVCCGC